MTTEQDASTTEAAPQVLGGIIPYLTVNGAAKAAEFYARAFGAKEIARHPVDEQGRTMHIHLRMNGGSLMLSDAYPEHGYPLTAPQAFSLLFPVEEAEAPWDRAVKAGREIVLPLQDMFWGDRYGQLKDPFDVMWAFNAPIKKD